LLERQREDAQALRHLGPHGLLIQPIPRGKQRRDTIVDGLDTFEVALGDQKHFRDAPERARLGRWIAAQLRRRFLEGFPRAPRIFRPPPQQSDHPVRLCRPALVSVRQRQRCGPIEQLRRAADVAQAVQRDRLFQHRVREQRAGTNR
jgi:hypothetical protein